ncbi:MAG: hypothetical protein GQ527_05680 [Bacteroidales bacterium]|nr:hypothetical protein [Bacteroidales bacterium]
MLKNPLPYLRFRKKATNRHGVHSPFIYKLLEDVIYKKKGEPAVSLNKNRRKEHQLYQRLFKHFNLQSAFLLKSDDFFLQGLKEYQNTNPSFSYQQHLNHSSTHNSYDVYILNDIENSDIIIEFMKLQENKNNSFVIIPQIRASKQQLEFWKRFTERDFAKVSLEFYHFGLVFFRKECSRQHFFIRF